MWDQPHHFADAAAKLFFCYKVAACGEATITQKNVDIYNRT